jgi:hypothetical protein
MISCTYCENADVKGILKLKSNEGGLEKDFETGLLICWAKFAKYVLVGVGVPALPHGDDLQARGHTATDQVHRDCPGMHNILYTGNFLPVGQGLTIKKICI